MASLEQSLMDLDFMTNTFLAPTYPTRILMGSMSRTDDDDFFKDLPQMQGNKNEQSQTGEQEQQKKEDQQGYSSYSYSTSSIVDENGRRISSSRRRYEDSTGRLKAVHERDVDGKRLTTIWNRPKKDEEGEHRTICSSGSPEDFEKLWSETSFGKAHQKKLEEGANANQKKPEENLQQPQEKSGSETAP
ncbi:unnamed protein product [Albugo candida]|uniref:Uncharacterized protein n=1 Tax=Albugo candida TaxID=65357 RepID=A0A024GK51_9STRA|nr:unnamed protein product [Albugo candida]|eukprot:CCI47148.1 unnamed protein product [Albugo candida]